VVDVLRFVLNYFHYILENLINNEGNACYVEQYCVLETVRSAVVTPSVIIITTITIIKGISIAILTPTSINLIAVTTCSIIFPQNPSL
jgi:hypothetical protein